MVLQRFPALSFAFRQLPRRTLATSAPSGRAVVFSHTGDPSSALSCLTFPPLCPPRPGTVNISKTQILFCLPSPAYGSGQLLTAPLEFLLSPINPSDINVIEGVYPSKPTPVSTFATEGKGSPEEPVFVCGNEGLAEVMAVGEGVASYQEGDWVILAKQQGGTWASSRNIDVEDVVKLPRKSADLDISPVLAATLAVNPATAYNMLRDFVHLKEGDWVLQNGANSAVGQCVIQIAAAKGLKTINLVRNREHFAVLEKNLTDLGATHVLTYDDLPKKTTRDCVQRWTNGRDIRLALNCVGGQETASMTRLIGQNAHLITYGAMSRQPVYLPASLFIFRDLKCHGFWQSRWYSDHSRDEREALIQTLMTLMSNGQLREPKHEIVTIDASLSDQDAAKRVTDAIAKTAEGRYGKKILLEIK